MFLWCSGRALDFKSRGPRFESGSGKFYFSIFLCHLHNFDLGLRTEMADPILKLAFHKRLPQIIIIHFTGLDFPQKPNKKDKSVFFMQKHCILNQKSCSGTDFRRSAYYISN